MTYQFLTGCYAVRQTTDREGYLGALRNLLGRNPSPSQTAKPSCPPLDFTLVAPLLDRAAKTAVNIIADNAAEFRGANTRDDYLDSRGDALCMTFTREYWLFEDGHFDVIEEKIAGEVLERARCMFQRTEAANNRGLALLDMHLKDACNAIKPLLAKQVSMLDEVLQ